MKYLNRHQQLVTSNLLHSYVYIMNKWKINVRTAEKDFFPILSAKFIIFFYRFCAIAK